MGRSPSWREVRAASASGTAERFVEEGTRVVIAGRPAEEGERLAKHLGPQAHFIRTDVTHEADIFAQSRRGSRTSARRSSSCHSPSPRCWMKCEWVMLWPKNIASRLSRVRSASRRADSAIWFSA